VRNFKDELVKEKETRVIDIHTHILPKVDDGSPHLIESIKMLQQAAADGILAVVCTPHILKTADFLNESLYIKRLEELKEMAHNEGIKIDLYLGSEIYIQPEFNFSSRMATLNNNGRYFLVEFPMGSIPRFAAEMFFTLIADGKIPIIAHPERNLGFIQHPEFAYGFVQRGALLQLNAGSLRGHFGPDVKKLAMTFLEHRLVHFIASDCHDSQRRKCRLKAARELVDEKWGTDYADELFLTNPQRVIKGEIFEPWDPLPIEKESSGVLKKLLENFNKIWK
jgi:protein-tyrosine phosphatase